MNNKSEDDNYIHLLGSPYFAIKNSTVFEIIKHLEIKTINILNSHDSFDYLFNEELNDKCIGQEVRIIVSEEVNGWNLIYLDRGNFEKYKIIIEKLSKDKKISSNYYYADPYVDGYEWIICTEGNIIREFAYQMCKISKNNGNYLTAIENRFIHNIENKNEDDFVFGGDVFYSIVKKTCDLELEKYKSVTSFHIGTIKL